MKKTLLPIRVLAALLILVPLRLVAQEMPAAEQEPPVYAPVADATTVTEEVQARYWIDRTALFAGDRVNYYLQIHCAEGVDLLAEDLDATVLELTGLELVDSEQHVITSDGTRTWHVRYTLTTYDLNATAMQIGAQTIRYYAGGGGASGTRSPSGEIVIPAAQLSLRSTLATEPMQSRLRDTVALEIMQAGGGWIATTGWLLLLFSAAPVGVWTTTLLRERAAEKQRLQAVRSQVVEEQGTLDRLSGLLSAAAADRRQGYEELNHLLREIIAGQTGINCNALTAHQIGQRLAAHGMGIPTEQLTAVLEESERARYGRPAQVPAADRFDAGVQVARTLLTAR